MQQRRPVQLVPALGVEAELLADQVGVRADALGVPARQPVVRAHRADRDRRRARPRVRSSRTPRRSSSARATVPAPCPNRSSTRPRNATARRRGTRARVAASRPSGSNRRESLSIDHIVKLASAMRPRIQATSRRTTRRRGTSRATICTAATDASTGITNAIATIAPLTIGCGFHDRSRRSYNCERAEPPVAETALLDPRLDRRHSGTSLGLATRQIVGIAQAAAEGRRV